jgi:hypothetical protein
MLTQVYFHGGHHVHRITSHYATSPGADPTR